MQHQIRLAGANLTLEKPVNRRELVAAVLTLLVK
jgi:DNA-binding response OmpR family regulator